MELTLEEKQIIVNLLNQISVTVQDAKVVIAIVDKLTSQIQAETPAQPDVVEGEVTQG